MSEDTQNEDKINQEIEELQEFLSLSQKNENDKPQPDPRWQHVGSLAIGTDSTIPIQATILV